MASAATRILRARGHFEVLGLPREQCTSAAVRAQFTKLVKEVYVCVKSIALQEDFSINNSRILRSGEGPCCRRVLGS